MHHSWQDSSEQVISLSQSPLPYNTQQTDIHATDGIWTHTVSGQVAADLRLRPPSHLDHWQLFAFRKSRNG